MRTEVVNRIRRFARAKSVFRARDLDREKLPRKYLAMLVQENVLERIGRGLYRQKNAKATEHQTLIEACKAVPRGVICLMSALAFHKFTTQLPHEVWIAIERHAWSPRIKQPKLRVVLMNRKVLELQVERHRFGGAETRVFSVSKTIVDCFKWRKVVGLDVALEALREFLKKQRSKVQEMMTLAKACHVESVMRPYVEALVG